MFGNVPEAIGAVDFFVFLDFFFLLFQFFDHSLFTLYPPHDALKLIAVIIQILWYCNFSFLPNKSQNVRKEIRNL